MVKQTWQQLGEWPIYKRLKLLKPTIRQWNTKVFGNIDDTLKRVEMELITLHKEKEIRELDEGETSRFQTLTSDVPIL